MKTYKIAILGWGSLLWNFDGLNLISDWRQTGIELPLAYSRISDFGCGRLTLVIDEKFGTPNQVWYALYQTDVDNLDQPITALKKRENTIARNIGYLNLKNRKMRTCDLSPDLVKNILYWAFQMDFDMVIWTALPSNWQVLRNCPYSIEDAHLYLDQITDPEIKEKALDYLQRSQKYIDIPFYKKN